MELLANTEKINNRQGKKLSEMLADKKVKIKNGEIEKPNDLGFPTISKYYRGFKKNQIIILGGRPNIGKTNVALNFVIKQIEKGKTVLWFDLEEQEDENLTRILTIIGQYPFKDRLESENLSEYEKKLLLKNYEAAEIKLAGMNLYYICKTSITLDEIENITKSYGQVDLIVIDHLTKVKTEAKGSRYEKVTDVACNLRNTSAKLGGIPFLVLAQVNRASTEGKDKEPDITDLKGSGEIEENADVIILLHRKSYFDKDGEQPDVEPIKIIIGKNRGGKRGFALLRWCAGLQTISEFN